MSLQPSKKLTSEQALAIITGEKPKDIEYKPSSTKADRKRKKQFRQNKKKR